jgi:hypothetical protein
VTPTAIAGVSVMATSREVDEISTDGVEDEVLGLRPLASVGDSK